jgi:hypothetical protein
MNKWLAYDSGCMVYLYLLCVGHLESVEMELVLTKHYQTPLRDYYKNLFFGLFWQKVIKHPYEIITKVCSLANFVEGDTEVSWN